MQSLSSCSYFPKTQRNVVVVICIGLVPLGPVQNQGPIVLGAVPPYIKLHYLHLWVLFCLSHRGVMQHVLCCLVLYYVAFNRQVQSSKLSLYCCSIVVERLIIYYPVCFFPVQEKYSHPSKLARRGCTFITLSILRQILTPAS